MRLMPTSITTAPGRTMSAVMNRGLADRGHQDVGLRVISGRFGVRLWQTVTVASAPGPFAPACSPAACRRCRCGRR